MKTFKLTQEYIQLNQLLKALAWCDNGAEANAIIDSGEVKVNGAVEFRRRNKIGKGFKVEYRGQFVLVE